MPFAPADLAALHAAEEIRIETRAAADQPVHRTIVWVVTDGPDAFVRSVRGTSARWYREVIAHPELTVSAGGTVLQARAVPATDPDSIARVNAGLVAKYTGIDGFEPMLVPDIFDATLRLEPA